MLPFLFYITLLLSCRLAVPEVKVAGAMRMIMMDGDFTAHIDLDSLDKKNLYAIGPVAGLKGELMVLDGKVYSTAKNGQHLENRQNKISGAAMLVYSYVPRWKRVRVSATIEHYQDLESLLVSTAKSQGLDLSVPFAFKLEAIPQRATYHVMDWQDGVVHSMANHKQFAYNGTIQEKNTTFLGFYSDHHHSIFTHHSTNMHVHVLEEGTNIVGHLEEINLRDSLSFYFPCL